MNIVFLCLANSVRSQMAEGLARKILGKKVQIQSAGAVASRVHPIAIQIMSEIEIDISGQHSKSLAGVDFSEVDFAITLCADDVCPPVSSRTQCLRWVIPEPICAGEAEIQLASFRKIRDLLEEKIQLFHNSIYLI